MSEITDLIKVMQEQMQRQEERHRQQFTVMQQQLDEQRRSAGTFASQKQTPPFPAFDSTAELYGRTICYALKHSYVQIQCLTINWLLCS